jgi:hypothetical protein
MLKPAQVAFTRRDLAARREATTSKRVTVLCTPSSTRQRSAGLGEGSGRATGSHDPGWLGGVRGGASGVIELGGIQVAIRRPLLHQSDSETDARPGVGDA